MEDKLKAVSEGNSPRGSAELRDPHPALEELPFRGTFAGTHHLTQERSKPAALVMLPKHIFVPLRSSALDMENDGGISATCILYHLYQASLDLVSAYKAL